ncbi:germinal-center associated nuclear protein isoform X1 [Diachasmimorpha longicaudata]|uniref:germinal-center associated nuclear protein isoform X1 n=1 Tax=Diachasmimorpha longicaudata TaxID=58733 RepID=UPI0030B8D789
MSGSILGRCSSMCPDKERRFREKEGLLHPFEIVESQKNVKKPEADPQKIIKCYSRSGAGKSMVHDLTQLRPGPVLLSTLRYLFTQIVTRSDVDWAVIYNFVFDRLRAVRQDLIIQRLDVSTTIKILEPIVRFHVYAAQRLCDRSLEDFVPKFNNQHLLECIKELLVKYDERDLESSNLFCSNRAQIETLYLLLYLGESATIERALKLPAEYRKSPTMKMAVKISLAWYVRNYVQVCRAIVKLPPLLAMAAMINLPRIRRDTLQVMSSAYNSTQLCYSGEDLRKLLLYKSTEQLHAECRNFGLDIINENICFQKCKFKVHEREGKLQKAFPDEMLHLFLPKIILN